METNAVNFELLFNTMNTSYAIKLLAPDVWAETNGYDAIWAYDLDLELSIIFKKRIRWTVQALKDMTVEIRQNVKLRDMNVNLSVNMIVWLRTIESIYRQMVMEASIKHEILKKILNSDFLWDNILKEEREINNEHHL